jgi:hypothetical protein
MRHQVAIGPHGFGRALYLYGVGGDGQGTLVAIAPLPPDPLAGPTDYRRGRGVQGLMARYAHSIGFGFDDLVSDLTSPIADAAQWVAGAGVTAIDAVGDVVKATANGVAGFSSDVWDVAKGAAGFVGSLPGINVAVHTFEDATHILREILDSPITALVVVALAAALNTVGLGSGLVAEYAALRYGMDMLDKLERGDTFTIGDIAQATIMAAGSATGLPVGAAVQATQTAYAVGNKVANKQPIGVEDVAGLIVQAATVGAGVSGDADAAKTVGALSAANKVAQASGLTGGQTLAKMPATIDQSSVAHLPDQVTRHVAGKIPGVAADSVVRATAGQNQVTAAVQHAQAELLTASKFGTVGSGLVASCGTYPDGSAVPAKRPDGSWNPDCPLTVVHQAQSGLRIGPMPAGTSLSGLFRSQAAAAAPAPAPVAVVQSGANTWAPFMTTPNSLKPVGLPESVPAYHLPITTGPRLMAWDTGP